MMLPESSGDSPTQCTQTASHTWQCREAKGKKRMSQKIDEAASSRRKGERFEAAAAAHNQKSGDLTRSSQLSQAPHDETVFWVCTACGLEREGDQIHDDPNGGPPVAVEVKCKPSLDIRDARQLGRNIQAVRQGGASGLIYKVPEDGRGNFLGSQIQKLGETAGVVIRIIKV